MPMDKRIKAKWCAALSSGKYRKGVKRLRKDDGAGGHLFCCLGVLTDIYLEEHGEGWVESLDGDAPEHAKLDSSLLSETVRQWAGLRENSPRVTRGGHLVPLSSINDRTHLDFPDISQLIEGSL